MPNLAASKKALRSSKRKAVYNQRKKVLMKKAVKRVRDLLRAGESKAAQEAMSDAYQAIDKAAKRGVIKKNTASRKKSRLVKMVKSEG